MPAKKPRFYFDTSVFDGMFDTEFSIPTRQLFERVRRGKIICVYSELTMDELENAPEQVRKHFEALPRQNLEFIKTLPEARILAQKYLDAKVVGQTSADDCLHIAIATLSRVDLLVSWNFKHIVNENRIHGYHTVNQSHGHIQLDIRSPRYIIYP